MTAPAVPEPVDPVPELVEGPGPLARRWHRLNGPARIAGVDLARGLAIIGMLAAHLLYTGDGWIWSDPATWIGIVDGRSSILFATLAGVSIGLVTGGAVPLAPAGMRPARQRLAARAGLLWLLGLLLILTGVPVYVILPAYAILFLLTLPFTALRAPVLFALAFVVAVVMSLLFPLLGFLSRDSEIGVLIGWAYPFPVWVAFLLAGLGLARAGITRRAVQWRMLMAGVGLAVLGYGLAEVVTPPTEYWAQVWTAEPHSTGLLEVLGSGGFAIAALGGCLLLCARADGRMTVAGWIALPLRATGAMPLTAYTAQLLVWALVAAVALGDAGDLYGFRALEPFWPLTLGITAGCTVWALLVGRGPLERATHRLSRLQARPTTVARLDS